MAKEWGTHKVEERLVKLKSLKDKYELTEKWKIWRDKVNMIEQNESTGENDFRTQISATVKRQKDAELSANMPEFSFIPMSDDAQPLRRIISEAWKYHWIASNSDRVVSKVVKSSTTYGTWIMYEWIKHTIKKEKVPFIKTVMVEWEEVRTIDYETKIVQNSGVFAERIPFLNFFVNGTDIENSTEAIVVRFYSKDEYISQMEYNPMYKNISKVRESSKDYAYTSEMDGADVMEDGNSENVITELSYYNSANDEYIVVANWIEVVSSPIPYSHKELPFCIYYDNEGEDRFWGIWELELLAEDEKSKNEYRSQTIKAVKASIWFLLWERWADIEVQDMNFGIWEYYETDDIEWIKHFAPNTPVWAISELEAKVDNDIVAKSWVDHKSLHLTPNESATKTANKQASTRKRINLNIRDNGFGFFRRLWMLRIKNIQQLHEMEPRRIPIEWGSINNEWEFIPDDANSFGSALIGHKFTKWEFLVMPITDTMLWDNKQRRKENLNNFLQIVWNMVENPDSIIKWKQAVKIACQEYGYDFEKLTETSESSQSPEKIVEDIFNEWWAEWKPQGWGKEWLDYSKMYQRDQVKTISWQAKIPYEWE